MKLDVRAKAALFYDLYPGVPEDLAFYGERLSSDSASVLELGCGTGRVLVPLAPSCGYIHGLDYSEAMLAICRKKLTDRGIPETRVQVTLGDITGFQLGKQFDLITAPYRVLQNLETDEQVDGLFDSIRQHLRPGGRCILNVFKPKRDWESMKREWNSTSEEFEWETQLGNRVVKQFVKRQTMDPDRMVLYPRLIYREYEYDVMVDETVLDIPMRCYYPDKFQQLVTDHGFEIVDLWGGYSGEPYGEGTELVIEFKEVSSGRID